MELVPCDVCGRHVRPGAASCPFCRARGGRARALHVVGGALTTLVLAACYGSPLVERPDFDGDNDGIPSTWDCDDQDPDVHPEADEVCGDGIDNDCDDDVDEADCVADTGDTGR